MPCLDGPTGERLIHGVWRQQQCAEPGTKPDERAFMATHDEPMGPPMAAGPRNKRRSALGRLIRYRLHIPMLRSAHPPEHTARGVMMGLIWAFVPLFGIQMGGVLVTWMIASRFVGWQFALIPAIAFTWVTNILTIVPVYYVYYITGQVMLGHWSDIAGYEAFAALFASSAPTGAGFFEAVWAWIETLLTYWGLPIVLGSIPWTIAIAAAGYKSSLNLVRAYRRRRAERMARRDRESGEEASGS